MSLSRPDEALPFAPREFGEIFSLAIRSGESRGAAGDDPWVYLGDTPDGENAIQVPNTPYNLAGLALRRHFGDDQDRYRSAMWRFRALMDLYARGALGAWVSAGGQGADTHRIHPAVLDVASRLRISRNGRFPVRKFVAAVAAAAARHYPDLDLAGGGDPDRPEP